MNEKWMRNEEEIKKANKNNKRIWKLVINSIPYSITIPHLYPVNHYVGNQKRGKE